MKNGVYKDYFNNGQLSTLGYYKNDMLDGLSIRYYDNGTVRAVVEGYRLGKLYGLIKQYWPNGNLRILETYNHGLYQGDFIQYYENGNIRSKAMFNNDKLVGTVKNYDLNGKFVSESMVHKIYLH